MVIPYTLVWAASRFSNNSESCITGLRLFEIVNIDRTIHQNAIEAKQQFIATVPSIEGLLKIKDCGEELRVLIRTRSEYAVEMEETLIDYSKEISEFVDFRNDFYANAGQARNNRVTRDSKYKPEL